MICCGTERQGMNFCPTCGSRLTDSDAGLEVLEHIRRGCRRYEQAEVKRQRWLAEHPGDPDAGPDPVLAKWLRMRHWIEDQIARAK